MKHLHVNGSQVRVELDAYAAGVVSYTIVIRRRLYLAALLFRDDRLRALPRFIQWNGGRDRGLAEIEQE